MVKFDERLYKIRIDRGMSRQQLATLLDISPRLVCYWENGKRRPKIPMLIKVSRIFDVSIDYLLGLID